MLLVVFNPFDTIVPYWLKFPFHLVTAESLWHTKIVLLRDQRARMARTLSAGNENVKSTLILGSAFRLVPKALAWLVQLKASVVNRKKARLV